MEIVKSLSTKNKTTVLNSRYAHPYLAVIVAAAIAEIPQPQPFSVEELLAMPPVSPDKLANVSG